MQQDQLEHKPCRAKECPALAAPKSVFGYCAVHNAVATDVNMFDKALAGKLTAVLKEFAKDCDRGIYPKTRW
jgi:hypothetical protein